jgi:hypothetical protein
MQWGPLLVPPLGSELTHHVRDSPSCDFIHGLHGKVFSAKAIVLIVSNDGESPQQVECDGTRAHFGGNKRRIESILLNGGKQRPDCGRIGEGRWLAFRSTVSGPMPVG